MIKSDDLAGLFLKWLVRLRVSVIGQSASGVAISVGRENNIARAGMADHVSPLGGLMVYAGGYTRDPRCYVRVVPCTRLARGSRANEGGREGSERERGSGAKCGGGGAVSMSGRVRHRRHTRRQYPANEWHAAASLSRFPASLTIASPGLPPPPPASPPPTIPASVYSRALRYLVHPSAISSATLRIINRPCKFPRPFYSPVEEPRAVCAFRPIRNSLECVWDTDSWGRERE